MQRIISVLILCILLVYNINAQVRKTIQTAKNGFQYCLVDDGMDSKSIMSLKGDIILQHCHFYRFIPDSIYGGYFEGRGLFKNYIVDMSNNRIISPVYFLKDFKRTATNKAYFTIFFKQYFGVCDLNGNIIIEPFKIKSGQDFEYDDSRNEFYISNGYGKKRKYLGVSLPDLDYATIASNNMQKMKESMLVNEKIEITDKEVDRFFYREIKKGIYVGVVNYKGDEIIPLRNKYTVVEFIPLRNGLGYFRIQKDNYIGIFDLTGNMVIPFDDKLDQITFYAVHNQEDSGIPGFFLLEKGRFKELRDLKGEVIIPFKCGYDNIRFISIKGKIGYFEGEKDDIKYAHDMSGELFATSSSHIHYYDNYGFSTLDKKMNKEIRGITLTKEGMADYSVQKYINAKNEEKRRQRAIFWSNLAQAFAELLEQTAQVTMAYSQITDNKQMGKTFASSSKVGSLTSKLEDPNYRNNVYQQLFNLSIAQVQFEEMQEYNQARDAYKRMGRDLSFAEFRALQGQAILDAKQQEYSSFNNTSPEYKDSGLVNTSSQTSAGFKCAYCNGTGRIERNDNAPASFGLSKANKKCNECGKIYDPTVFNHYHVQCGHCGGTGYNK